MSAPYNDHRGKLEQARLQFASNAADYDAAVRDLAWYAGFDPQVTHACYNAIQREQRDAIDALHRKREEVDRQEAEIRRLERAVPPAWHFLESSLRAVTLAELAVAKTRRETLQAELTALAERTPDLAESEALELSLARYRQFDPLQAEAKRHRIPPVQEVLATHIAELSEQHNRIEAALKPLRADMAGLEQEELRLVVEHAKAEALVKKMETLQADPGGRREVHQECAKQFQVRDPTKAVAEKEGKLEAVRRQKNKLSEEMKKQAQRALHDVRTVVIDGSNLCYVEGQKDKENFIGLRALDALVPELAARYEKVILYFDYGEQHKMGLTKKTLKKHYDNWTKRVYVMKSGDKADEFILSSAQGDEHAYVISGDLYREHLSRFSYITKRRLGAMVTHDQVQLHDLNLILPLAPQ